MMSPSKPQVVIDGHWLTGLMPWGDLEWVTCWPGGTESITFSVSRSHRLFRPGAIVELDYGGERLAVGSMVEPTRGEPLMAEGLHRKAEDYAALDSSDEATVNASTAVTDAITRRNMPWVDTDPFPASGPALDPDQPHSIAQLLDHKGDTLGGLGWGIDPATRQPYFADWLPTDAHMLPGVDGLAISRDGYASTLKARYLDSATSTYKTVTGHDQDSEDRWGYVERTLPQPLTEGVPMSTAEAQAIVDGYLSAGRYQIGWASPLEVQYGDIVTAKGRPVDLNRRRARQTVRLHGLDLDVSDLSGRTWFDMKIARTRHRVGFVTLEPLGLSQPMNDALAGASA